MAIIEFDTWFETVEHDYPNRIHTVEEAEAKAREKCASQGGQHFTSSRDDSDPRGMWLFTWHTHVGLCLMTPAPGKKLEVVKGRKLPKGTVGECIWAGETRFGFRVGIKVQNDVVWTDAKNVQVV